MAGLVLPMPGQIIMVPKVATPSDTWRTCPNDPRYEYQIRRRDLATTIDAYVGLLTHLDGVDAATEAEDVSANAHTITFNGSAAIEDSDGKFAQCCVFPGNGSYLQVADHASLDSGTGPFTIEFWGKVATTWPNMPGALSHGGSSAISDADGWRININTGHFDFQFRHDGEGNVTSTPTLPTGAWVHFAFTRDSSSDCRLFINGTQVGSTTNCTKSADSSSPFRVNSSNDAGYWGGAWSIDELKVSDGIARYVANFTPRAKAWS